MDDFIETLRADYRENMRKYNARNPLRKLFDAISWKTRMFSWKVRDWLNGR